ncbi:vascular endothelial growth factor Ab isoform X3 [Electrophorus electricus]|uniref:Platelet-derived growth factor (PDGF) family profile domain-containing protein n=1 Tax=Electrophorus electricus TaxID=8005 RepID=A0A4W4HR68_ELEEL|nr:vascular endothelial growth factor Ab isoform X3 [Electrophorus electricus]
MSTLFSEIVSNAFEKVRLSTDRILNRLSRFVFSIMNFAVRLLQLFCVTLLYFSAVKSAYIPRENGGATHDVVSFTEVYNKSICRPRELLVDVQKEYPEDIEHIFIPSCVVLMRCAGCCNDEMLECTPIATHNVTLEVQKLKPRQIRGIIQMSFTVHTECQCRLKKDIQEKTENLPFSLSLSGYSGNCKPCCSACSERRKRLFVQDPETCKCSCKHSEADCRLKQLELNERTCRCDRPRR